MTNIAPINRTFPIYRAEQNRAKAAAKGKVEGTLVASAILIFGALIGTLLASVVTIWLGDLAQYHVDMNAMFGALQ